MANLAFYRVRVNECPNEKYRSQSHTLTVTTFSVQKRNFCILSIKSKVT